MRCRRSGSQTSMDTERKREVWLNWLVVWVVLEDHVMYNVWLIFYNMFINTSKTCPTLDFFFGKVAQTPTSSIKCDPPRRPFVLQVMAGTPLERWLARCALRSGGQLRFPLQPGIWLPPLVIPYFERIRRYKNGCFQKWWCPQIIHFNRVFHYKPSILGYPYFWKHPNVFVNGTLMNSCFFDPHETAKFFHGFMDNGGHVIVVAR